MNEQTTLFRQVHPTFIQDGRLSSQAFSPTPKDENKLSVYNGELITAANAYAHYTEKHQSAGVWGVTVSEVAETNLCARPAPEDFAEHAVIDFSGHSSNAARKHAKKLRDFAVARGCLHSPA